MQKSNKPPYKYCIVPLCKNTNRNAPDKVFFLIPRGANIREKWCKIMKRGMISPTTCLYCCEDHFDLEEDTANYIQYKIMNLQEKHKTVLRLKKGIYPHKFQCQKNTEVQLSIERQAHKKRRHLERIEEALSAPPAIENVTTPNLTELSINIETGPSTTQIHIEDIEMQNLCEPGRSTTLSTENKMYVDRAVQVTSSLRSSSIAEVDPLVDTQFKNQMRTCMLLSIEKEPKMLIGVPKSSYYLIKCLSQNVPLPTVDILITLKKLKLNESFSILALQFGYTQSTISRIFSKSIPVLAKKMKELIPWQTPAKIFKNLPIAFRAKYSNVVSIIDCLEIQINKPSNVVYQSLTWSQYKKFNTLKYLISYTPDGLVTFISDGYGGRATNVMIVEDCGFLNLLQPNTAILADSGFKAISHLLAKKNCTLIQPLSVSNATTCSKDKEKQAKQIAALKIHVERVISRLREFHILLPHASVDHNLFPVIDEVIIIVCGLINMQGF